MTKYHLGYLKSAIHFYDGYEVETCTGVRETYELLRSMNPLQRGFWRAYAAIACR